MHLDSDVCPNAKERVEIEKELVYEGYTCQKKYRKGMIKTKGG